MQRKNKEKIVFFYEGPSFGHAVWAKAIGAKFIPDLDPGPKMGSGMLKRIWNGFRRLFILSKIPKDTDILLVEGGLGFIVGWLFKKFRKKKVIMIVADPLFKALKENKFAASIILPMLKKFDGFLPVADMMYDLIPFKQKRNIRTFYENQFKKIKPNCKKNNLISVGIIDERKGTWEMIKIFNKIKKKIKDAKFYLVGRGPLKENVENKKIPGMVLTGYDKPEKYFPKCPIYLAFSKFDPFPASVLEAMASGLVPIITPEVGSTELIKDIDPGLIIKNEKQAANKIIQLLKNKKKLKQLSNKIKKKASKFTKENSIKMFKKSFYELASS